MNKVKLSEICDLKNGYAFKSKDYIEKSNTVVCRMSNIRPDGKYNIDYSIKYVPDEFAEIYKDYLLEDGDVIVAMTDMANDPKIIGKPTIVETKGYNVLLNQRVGKLVFKKQGALDKKYLKFALSVPSLKNYYKKFAGGGLQINIGKKDILNIEIPLPELYTQRRIVSVLDKAQDLIDKRKAQIEALDQLTQSVFLEMFGDPINNKKSWDVAYLGDLSKDIKYGTNEKGIDNKPENGLPVLRIPNIEPSKLNLEDVKFVKLDEKEKKKLMLQNGDLLFVRSNGNPDYIGRCAMFNLPEDFVYASYLIRVRIEQEKILPEFLQYQLSTHKFRKSIAKLSRTTAGNYNLNTQSLRNLQVILPPINLQKEYINKVTEIKAQEKNLQASYHILNDLFNSFLQRALKGELFIQEKLPNV